MINQLRWIAIAAVLIIALSAASCSKFPGLVLDEFDQIPRLEELNYDEVTTSRSFDYWELRLGGFEENFEVIASGGSIERDAVDPNLLAEFDATTTEDGFSIGCLPAYCFKYIASIDGTEIELWDSIEELVEFLSPIETAEEAILVALAHDYHWHPEDKKAGAIREQADHFEMIALKLVKFCVPVQTDRFLLTVDRAGELEIVASEVWEQDDLVCI